MAFSLLYRRTAFQRRKKKESGLPEAKKNDIFLSMKNKLCSLFVCLAVSAACAAGAPDFQKNIVPAQNQVRKAFCTFGAPTSAGGTRVLYVGNSITRHGPKPSMGWTNDCGMAASSIDKDYVHVNAVLVAEHDPKASFAYMNVAGTFERSFMEADWSPEKTFAEARAFNADRVVFFFGANVPKTYDADPSSAARSFGDAVLALRDYLNASGKTKFYLSEGFYVRPVLDAEKKAAAAKRGDTYVRMDDIRTRTDTHGRFNHPGDLGMRLIAERFHEAMYPGASPSSPASNVPFAP